MTVIHSDIMEWAVALTKSTGDTLCGDVEFLVGNEQLIKECVSDMRVKPGQLAFNNIDSIFAMQDTLSHLGEALACSVDFAMFTFWGVQVEGLKVDIGFGHDERVGEMEGPTERGNELGEAFHCVADAVATSTGKVEIRWRTVYIETLEIGRYNARHGPRVNGADDSKRFVIPEGQGRLAVRRVYHPQEIACCLCEFLRNKSAVATS